MVRGVNALQAHKTARGWAGPEPIGYPSGRGGADIVTGASADTFGFKSADPGAGEDRVADFSNGDGGNVLDFTDLPIGGTGNNLSDFVTLSAIAGDTHVTVAPTAPGRSDRLRCWCFSTAWWPLRWPSWTPAGTASLKMNR